MRALDFFAADGTMLSHRLLKDMDVTAWDILPCVMDHFAKVKVQGDSFILAKQPEYQRAFDYILIDNVAGLFGASRQYCEHFEALSAAIPLLNNEATVAFNVVTSPAKYTLSWLLKSWRILPEDMSLILRRWLTDYYAAWDKTRLEYYGKLMPDNRLVYWRFYYNIFEKMGYRVTGGDAEKRLPGLWLFTYKVRRRET